MDSHVCNIAVSNPAKYKKLYLRPATLYYLRLQFPDGTILYKLGYTTTSLQERVHGRAPTVTYKYNAATRRRERCYASGHIGMGLPKGTNVYIIDQWQHGNASYVYQVEQELHVRYAEARWQGLPLLANGNTELYTRDILGLDW